MLIYGIVMPPTVPFSAFYISLFSSSAELLQRQVLPGLAGGSIAQRLYRNTGSFQAHRIFQGKQGVWHPTVWAPNAYRRKRPRPCSVHTLSSKFSCGMKGDATTRSPLLRLYGGCLGYKVSSGCIIMRYESFRDFFRTCGRINSVNGHLTQIKTAPAKTRRAAPRRGGFLFCQYVATSFRVATFPCCSAAPPNDQWFRFLARIWEFVLYALAPCDLSLSICCINAVCSFSDAAFHAPQIFAAQSEWNPW